MEIIETQREMVPGFVRSCLFLRSFSYNIHRKPLAHGMGWEGMPGNRDVAMSLRCIS